MNPPGEHLFSSGPSVSFPFILLLAPFCSLRTSALLDASRYQGWAPVSIRSAQAAPVSAPAALVPNAGYEQTRDCSAHVVLVQEASLSSGADSLPSGCGQSAAAAHVGGLQRLDLARPRARPRRRRLDLRRRVPGSSGPVPLRQLGRQPGTRRAFPCLLADGRGRGGLCSSGATMTMDGEIPFLLSMRSGGSDSSPLSVRILLSVV